MRRSLYAATTLIGLALAACAPRPAPKPAPKPAIDTAGLSSARWGALWGLQDAGAATLSTARWAFADAGNLAGDPAEAARAVAAIEYLAGEMNTDPRWFFLSSAAKDELLDARTALRALVGAAPEARSQVVMDNLIDFAARLKADDTAGARAQLTLAAFPNPDETMRRLQALPFSPIANLATAHAAQSLDAIGQY